MGRDTRTYITVHDGMPEHPKVEPLSDAAFRLLVESWCWSSRQLSDGFIPAGSWARRGSPKARRELEAAGLVEPVEGGVYCHDYTEHQRTRAEVEDVRSKRAAAGKLGGEAKARAKQKAGKPLASATANGVANGVANAKQKPTSVSVSEVSEQTTTPPGGAEAPQPEVVEVVEAVLVDDRAPTAQTLVAEWIDHCGERPVGSVIGQVSKRVGAMLAEGIPYEHVRAGLASWHGKGLHPATLDSEVHLVRTASQRTPRASRDQQQTDDWYERAFARAQAADERASA